MDEHKDVANTAAGVTIKKELTEESKRHEAELKKAQKGEMRELREKGEEIRQEGSIATPLGE